MAFDLNAFNQKYGTTLDTSAGDVGHFASGATAASAPKVPGFFSQVGHSLATTVPAVAGALYHGVVDPFSHLIENNVNAASQGSNADGINTRRQALDAQYNQLLKQYSSKQITKAQFNAAAQKHIAASQALSNEAQGNIDSVKSTAQMLPDAAQAAATALTLGAGGLELGAAKAGAEALGARVAGSAGAKVAGKAVQGVSDVIGAGKGMGGNLVAQLPGKIVRNAVVTQPTVQFAGQAGSDVRNGNLPGVATDATLLAAPAAAGLIGKGVKAVLPAIKDALHGTSATLTDALGVSRVKQFLAENANNPQAITSLKRMELFTQNQPAVVAGSITPGAKLAEHLKSIGVDPKTAPIADIVKQFDAYAGAHETLEAAKAGNADAISAAVEKNKVATAIANATNADIAAKANVVHAPIPAHIDVALTKNPFPAGSMRAELFDTAQTHPELDLGREAATWRSNNATGFMADKSLDRAVNDVKMAMSDKQATTSPSSKIIPGPTKPDLVKVPSIIHPNAVVSADFRKAIPEVVSELQKLGDNPSGDDKIAAVDNALGHLGNMNETVRTKIAAALTELGSGSEMASKLKPIIQRHIIFHPDVKLPTGFIATEGPASRAALPSVEEASKAGMPVVGSNPHGILGKVGTALDRAGVGLRTTNPKDTSTAITSNLNTRLEGTEFAGQGKDIMNRLHEATSKTKGIFDPRLLRATTGGLVPGAVSIEHELNVSPKEAKQILSAVKSAYADVPLGTRSLGEKLTDRAIKYIPPMASYLKAQGYGKFSMNPFFWAKQATKGEFIAQTETGGKALNAGRILNGILGTAPKDETMSLIRESGLFSKSGMAGGEADFMGNLAPELSAKITKPEVSGYIQQSMGQAAEQFAKNNGTSVKDILRPENGETHPLKSEFDHLMEMVVGYPKGANALNTNLAKSLNVLVFPSRFETKVAMAAAHYFTAQPKIVQLAMINSTLKANAWASSPEGQKWQKDNADLMSIINYFSPTHSLEAVVDTLKSGNVADLGQVGGMPFGVITTILKNQGVALPNQLTGNDTNPATGEAYVQKLPTSTKARIQQGITDLVGQMFSFPGATVGLPSKTSVIQGVPGLKINPKEQNIVKPPVLPSISPGNGSPTTITAPKGFSTTIPSIKSNVKPIYRPGHVIRGKVHAVRPV